MIYIEDSTNKVGVYAHPPGKERFEFHRLTAREAMCYTQTAKHWKFWVENEEPLRQTPSWTTPHKNEYWQPNRLNGCLVVTERVALDYDLLERIVYSAGCEAMLLERCFDGEVYHYSPDAAKIVKEGMKCNNSFSGTGHLSFGPGCYVYYDERYKQDGTKHPWVKGRYKGILYECLWYDDEYHLDYGYIPYDFQQIKWELLTP